MAPILWDIIMCQQIVEEEDWLVLVVVDVVVVDMADVEVVVDMAEAEEDMVVMEDFLKVEVEDTEIMLMVVTALEEAEDILVMVVIVVEEVADIFLMVEVHTAAEEVMEMGVMDFKMVVLLLAEVVEAMADLVFVSFNI